MLDQRLYYYKTSNLEIGTQKVWFGSVSDWSLVGFLASHCLKVRAKPNLLGTNFKIGSLWSFTNVSQVLDVQREPELDDVPTNKSFR